jgi:hypothetical protein
LVRKTSARWLHPPWLCPPSARTHAPARGPFFAARHSNRIELPHSHFAAPGNSPSSRVAPLQSPRNHASHRQRRGAAAICLPHPSRRRLTHPPPSSERRRRCSSHRAFLCASDPERRLLLRSSSAPPIQGKQQIQAGAGPFTSPGDSWSAGVSLLPILRGTGRLCRRSRTLPLHLLPPRQKSSFLHAAFRNDARPDGPRFHERMACSGECSWNQAINT